MFATINQKRTIVHFATLFLLYFVQAMPYGFQSRYLPLQMRKQGVSLTSLGLYKLLLVPWICKFFVAAFVVDSFKTKKYWLYFSLVALSAGSFVGSLFENDFNKLALVIFLLNWACVVQDICVDWFAMNLLDEENLGLGNTIQVGSFKLGTLFSGGLLVYLLDYLTIANTFIIIGSVYFLTYLLLRFSYNLVLKKKKDEQQNCSTAKANENDNDDGDNEKMPQLNIREKLRLLHRSPATYWTCAFVLIYKLG